MSQSVRHGVYSMDDNKSLVKKNNDTVNTGTKKAELVRKTSSRPAAKRSTADLTNIQIVTKKKKTEKKPFPLTTVFTSVCFTCLFLFMMLNYIALDDLNDKVDERSDTIMELREQREELERKVTLNENYNEIAEYAENNLGMVTGEGNFEQYYIDIHKGDDVKISKYEDESENGLGTLLTGAGSVLRKFFGK